MNRVAVAIVGALTIMPVIAGETCYDKVEVGDPVQHVIERCGEPVRRERERHTPGKPVELIRGSDTLKSYPLQPQRLEKWYYETTRDKATVIEIQDGGVLGKKRLERTPAIPAGME
jgi:hypothetical protein